MKVRFNFDHEGFDLLRDADGKPVLDAKGNPIVDQWKRNADGSFAKSPEGARVYNTITKRKGEIWEAPDAWKLCLIPNHMEYVNGQRNPDFMKYYADPVDDEAKAKVDHIRSGYLAKREARAKTKDAENAAALEQKFGVANDFIEGRDSSSVLAD